MRYWLTLNQIKESQEKEGLVRSEAPAVAIAMTPEAE
jgi:hypothetical protein